MRADIAPGGPFRDYEPPDHASTPRGPARTATPAGDQRPGRRGAGRGCRGCVLFGATVEHVPSGHVRSIRGVGP
jgi:hypothetical protein